MTTILEKDDKASLVRLLNEDKVGIFPVDTIYGLNARANGKNQDRLYEIKNRPKSKSFITLMTVSQLKASGLIVPEILYSVFPESLTVILMGKDGMTYAVRVPDDEDLLSVIDETGPLFSTSVNQSGSESLLEYSAILPRYDGKVDFIVRNDEIRGGLASTLVDMSKKPYRIIRQGKYDASDLLDHS